MSDENEWVDLGDGVAGISDIDNITAQEFLQQMYYMCEAKSQEMGVPIEMLGSTTAFLGIDGTLLHMLVVPYNMEENDGVRIDNLPDTSRFN